MIKDVINIKSWKGRIVIEKHGSCCKPIVRLNTAERKLLYYIYVYTNLV